MRLAVLLVAVVALSGCPKSVRPPPPQPEPLPPAPVVTVPGATFYAVNPQASKVHVLVFKAGTLARFGHNHVMSVQDLKGRVWVHPSLDKSGFDFSFPVANLIVDDPAARTEAGSDFPREIPQKDRQGTRDNMLRAEVLDAEHYPKISLRSVKLSGTAEHPSVTARITIRNATHDVTLTPMIKIQGKRLTASGEFDIQQTDFGIKPFTAALGALAVQDRLHVKFDVVAEEIGDHKKS
jgi:hypothetical protein